ncbi:V-set and immunoglobulin domain-containing protein 10 [Anoplopoma fimbria]|uniref:V-set and immunoglobulin domain-containing protein 10 n=1 Tax=Anoplopoma fimbria TaxID=229290 RepID=UPI0023EBFFC5|nr:V-set and immunoglobulin domain-containing protein 10 [Anoplopoma fimbria]XP_054467144.1 V-set and immunoglobulin domain-containing protein 10 [Anoplopoma fimbria]
MKIVTTAAFLHLCFCASAAVSDSDSTETALVAAPGDVAELPCYTVGKATPLRTTWTKNGREVMTGEASSPGELRLEVTNFGSLKIKQVMLGDEGDYLCGSTLPGNNTFHARVSLQVTSGPENVSASIGPATALSNGTLIVFRGSSVSFNCSGSSYPSQRLTWAFRGDSSSNESLASNNGSWLDFRMEDVQPSAQGVYSCMAHNPVSDQAVNKSTQLLVYYVPDRHPECMWAPAQDSSHVHFNCIWFGAYPVPTLGWGVDQGDQGAPGSGNVYASEMTESLSVTLNRSMMSDGQTVRCKAQHLALGPGPEKSCSFTLKSPYPEGEPLATALEETNVTLTCTELVSIPPANTTWRKGLQQEDIIPGSKYVLSEEGPVLKLQILNVSKDDEGVYFCRSENPLAIRVLEVYLTVKKTSSAYTGAIIGVFIAALIVGSAAILAKTLYFNRHRICLGDGFGQVDDDRGDVLSLVESDDEQIFQDAVPRLPPLTNGHQTTLVQIHRIPSSDHEDTETADTSPQQQEDTVQTEEPVDLVTF